MLKHVLFDIPLSAEDTWRNNRAQIAIRMKKLPHEIDAMPYEDYVDLMDVMGFNDEMQRIRAHRRV